MSLNKLLALRAFASDYHSGQDSRGYRLLSLTSLRLEKRPIYRLGNQDALLAKGRRSKLYGQLVRKYADKI